MRAGLLAALLLIAAGAAAQDSGSNEPSLGAVRSTPSGFSDDLPGAVPKRNKPYYRQIPPPILKDPDTARVIIYSHGTRDSTVPENCNAPGNAVPPSIRALTAEGVHVWYLCSMVAERASRENAGRFVYSRMREVGATIKMFREMGVRRENLWLAGHSAGGWTSLMMAKDWGEEIAGIIAYAPAFARKREDEAKYPWWRREVRPAQVAEMKTARTMRALVFAYDNDAFDRPQDLAFLAETWPRSVTLWHWSCSVENDHMSHLDDCRAAETARAVRDFVLGGG